MKIENLKKLELELAFSIVWHILKDCGGKANWSYIRLEYLKRSENLKRRYGIDVTTYFDKVLRNFPRDKHTGSILIPKGVIPRKPQEIVEELSKRIIEESKSSLPNELLEAAKRYNELRRRMEMPENYLLRFNSSYESTLNELTMSSNIDEFLRTYSSNAPAAFEFIIAKSFSLIFQVPLYIGEFPSSESSSEGIVWYGKLDDNNKAVAHAPGGKPDIIVYARGPYYVMIEATLRYTPKQWREEIEPIFRHTSSFIKQGPSEEDVYLVFIVAGELLEDTYKWLRARANEYNVLALRAGDIVKLVKVSSFILGLPHAEIRRLFSKLHEKMTACISKSIYMKHVKETIDEWCKEVLQPYLGTFLALKAYGIISKEGGFIQVRDVLSKLSNTSEVSEYLEMIGLVKSIEDVNTFLRQHKRNIIRTLSLFGLIRETNGVLRMLPKEEFEERLMKMYGAIEDLQT